MTDETTAADDAAARIAALKAKGEEAGEEAKKPREKSINWNKGLKEGDMIAGLLVRGDKVQVKGRDEPSYLMEIRDHETQELYVVWCGNYMLREAIAQVAPAKDSLVVVQFHGKQQSTGDSSRSFNVFTVEAERSDHEYWQEIEVAFLNKPVPTAPAVRQSFGPDEAPF